MLLQGVLGSTLKAEDANETGNPSQRLREGDLIELAEAAPLLADSNPEAEVIQELSKGTLVSIVSMGKGSYLRVSLEAPEGTLTGWIPKSVIKESSSSASSGEPNLSESSSGEGQGAAPKRKSRLKKKRKTKNPVPTDESAVLRREPSFAYGFYGGANYNVITHIFGDLNFNGIGFLGGGNFKFFVNRDMLLGIDVSYLRVQGSDPNGLLAGFGILDTTAILEGQFGGVRLFAGAGYGLGIGISNLPLLFNTVTKSSDISSIWGKVGGGYAFAVSEISFVVLKFHYGISLTREPVGFHTFAITTTLEFQG